MSQLRGSDGPGDRLIREACRNARVLSRICDFLDGHADFEVGAMSVETPDDRTAFVAEDPDERPYIWELEEE